MSQTCPQCGAVNRATNRFCSRCGTRLIPAEEAAQTQTGMPAETADTPAAEEPQAFSTTRPLTGAYGGSSTAPEAPVTYRVQRWEPEPPTGSVASDQAAFIPPPPPSSYSQEQPSTPYSGYQGYSPGASGRREGGMYAPYSADAARALEQQKPQRSWLWPAVVVAGLVLLALAAVTVFLVVNNKGVNLQPATGPQQPSAFVSPTPLPANASEEDKVKAVIVQSNNEQIQAWKTLDTSVLSGTRTGPVLDENIQMVQELQRNNMYAVPVNQRLDIKDVKVSGNQAVAHTFEVWTVTYYTKDGQEIRAMGPDSLTETYYLVKQNGRWLINRLDIYGEGTPTPGGV